MRKLELATADVKILVSAMTFIALLVVLLLDDSCLDPSLIAPAWLPFPILLLLNQVSIVGRHSSDASCSRRHSASL